VKRTTAVILLLFAVTVLQAQNNNPFFELKTDSSFRWGAGVFANYNIGSTALTNGFINSFYKGGFINDAQKNRVENKLKSINQLGGDANAGIYYLQKLDTFLHKKTVAWFVSVKNRQHANAAFSRDLFNVAFYGNSSYRGQTADFSGFDLNIVQYQQFQAGLIGDRFGVGLSVYNGQQFLLLKAKTAQMYTSPFGEYIDFNTSYSMIVSDTKHTNPGAMNGIGTGLDLYGRMPVEMRNGLKGDLEVGLTDLGFIHWNNQTNHYKNDTLYHFDGFAIKNAFQLADTSIHYTAKSVLNAKASQQTAYASHLPATLDVKFVPLGIHYQWVLGIRYRFSSDYKPYGYAQFRYHFGTRFSATAEIGYGGYANLQSGLTLQASFKKGYALQLGTNNLFGYVFPLNSCGQGMYVSISKVFR
jgi:hypothetical protein